MGRVEVLIAVGCMLLGYLYVETERVSPAQHHYYEREIARLASIDTRINQRVLQAGAGLLHHYDDLVRSNLERSQAIYRISSAPPYLSDADRQSFEEALARYQREVERKSTETERFKSAHAAVRGSLTYLPIVSRTLLTNLETAGSETGASERIREDIGQVITYMAVSGSLEHRAGHAALNDLRHLAADPPTSVDAELLAAVITHARNVLERKPELDRLMRRIIDAPTKTELEALRLAYRQGYDKASLRAARFQRVLYLCSVIMLILVATSIRRLSGARQHLAQVNASLEERVCERTKELAEAKDRLETDGRALKELNEMLQVSYRDLDETRRSQLELRDKFLSHVSHELRTPLTAVHQFISLVLDGVGGEVRDEQREYLEVAFRNVKQLTRMISDLMEVTRAQSGKLRLECHPLGLGDLVHEVISTLEAKAASTGIQLAEACDENLPYVFADEARVRQVLNNLVENAIKFTSEGGSIQVSVAQDRQAGMVCVSVQDSGCGIESDALERVFEQLYQESSAEVRSRKGLGLGLSICKELIDRQGGRIWAESELGVGSTFRFTLPVFRLEELVEKVVRTDTGVRQECSLIRVGIRPRTDGDLAEILRRSVRHKLRQLLYVESDVMLPRLEWRSDREQFWIIAGTGTEGVAAIIRRVDERLVSGEEGEGLVFDVDSEVFEIEPQASDGADLTDVIDSIGRFIQEHIGRGEQSWNERRSLSSTTTPISGSV